MSDLSVFMLKRLFTINDINPQKSNTLIMLIEEEGVF